MLLELICFLLFAVVGADTDLVLYLVAGSGWLADLWFAVLAPVVAVLGDGILGSL